MSAPVLTTARGVLGRSTPEQSTMPAYEFCLLQSHSMPICSSSSLSCFCILRFCPLRLLSPWPLAYAPTKVLHHPLTTPHLPLPMLYLPISSFIFSFARKAFPFSKSLPLLKISLHPALPPLPEDYQSIKPLHHHLSLLRLRYQPVPFTPALSLCSLPCVCTKHIFAASKLSSWRYHPAFMGWRCGWQEKARRVPLEVVLAVAFMCLAKACFALCSRQIRRFVGRSAWRFSW